MPRFTEGIFGLADNLPAIGDHEDVLVRKSLDGGGGDVRLARARRTDVGRASAGPYRLDDAIEIVALVRAEVIADHGRHRQKRYL
jgi:hypothetical protein